MITEIRFDKIYLCENKDLDITGTLNFSKSDLGDTWATFILNSSNGVHIKNVLLTQEDVIDEFDIESINGILDSQGLSFTGYDENNNHQVVN